MTNQEIIGAVVGGYVVGVYHFKVETHPGYEHLWFIGKLLWPLLLLYGIVRLCLGKARFRWRG